MIPFATLPLGLYPIFFIILSEITLPIVSFESLALLILLSLQLWALALLGRAIQASKSIPYDRAIIPALIFGYLSTILGFLLS